MQEGEPLSISQMIKAREDYLAQVFTPDAAKEHLIELGFEPGDWDGYLKLLGSAHEVRAFIRIAQGDKPGKLDDLYWEERKKDNLTGKNFETLPPVRFYYGK